MDIKLRPWTMSDLPQIVDLMRNVDSRYLRRHITKNYNEDMAREFVNTSNSGDSMFRAILVDDIPVGNISVEVHDSIQVVDGTMGYYLRSDYAGKGIATYAVQLMKKEAFKSLEIVRLSAYVCTKNIASVRVLQKNGFMLDGVMRSSALIDGEIVDVAIYSILRDEVVI